MSSQSSITLVFIENFKGSSAGFDYDGPGDIIKKLVFLETIPIIVKKSRLCIALIGESHL